MLHKLAMCQGTIFKLLTSQNICATLPPSGYFWQLPLDLALLASQIKLNESTNRGRCTNFYDTYLCILNLDNPVLR